MSVRRDPRRAPAPTLAPPSVETTLFKGLPIKAPVFYGDRKQTLLPDDLQEEVYRKLVDPGDVPRTLRDRGERRSLRAVCQTLQNYARARLGTIRPQDWATVRRAMDIPLPRGSTDDKWAVERACQGGAEDLLSNWAAAIVDRNNSPREQAEAEEKFLKVASIYHPAWATPFKDMMDPSRPRVSPDFTLRFVDLFDVRGDGFLRDALEPAIDSFQYLDRLGMFWPDIQPGGGVSAHDAHVAWKQQHGWTAGMCFVFATLLGGDLSRSPLVQQPSGNYAYEVVPPGRSHVRALCAVYDPAAVLLAIVLGLRHEVKRTYGLYARQVDDALDMAVQLLPDETRVDAVMSVLAELDRLGARYARANKSAVPWLATTIGTLIHSMDMWFPGALPHDHTFGFKTLAELREMTEGIRDGDGPYDPQDADQFWVDTGVEIPGLALEINSADDWPDGQFDSDDGGEFDYDSDGDDG